MVILFFNDIVVTFSLTFGDYLLVADHVVNTKAAQKGASQFLRGICSLLDMPGYIHIVMMS